MNSLGQPWLRQRWTQGGFEHLKHSFHQDCSWLRFFLHWSLTAWPIAAELPHVSRGKAPVMCAWFKVPIKLFGKPETGLVFKPWRYSRLINKWSEHTATEQLQHLAMEWFSFALVSHFNFSQKSSCTWAQSYSWWRIRDSSLCSWPYHQLPLAVA